MANHRRHSLDDIYKYDEWRLIETAFDERRLAAAESIFALANGYVGMRGTCDEGQPVAYSGTYVNGFHETWPIVYGEEAFGFAKVGQTIVDVPDAKILRLQVDDEPLFLPTATLDEFERVLDMRAGTLDRRLVWRHSSGQRVTIASRRLVSLEHRHLAAIVYDVTLADDAPVVIESEIADSRNITTATRAASRRGAKCSSRASAKRAVSASSGATAPGRAE